MSGSDGSDNGGSQRPSRALWIVAALAALTLHAGAVAFAIVNLQGADIDDEMGAPAIEIGLEPMAPRAEPTDLPPGPESDASAASAAQVEQKMVQKDSDLPKETPQDTAEPDRLVSPSASKKPDNEPDTPTQQATPSNAVAASEATAMPTSQTAQPSDRSVTPTQGTGEARQRVKVAWQKELVAYLDRHKRYPTDREQKAAEILVSFTLDRSGHVVASRIAQSSGDPSFDAAALAMLTRSDPVPAPPALIADEGLDFTLPVIFRVKGRH